MSCSWCVIHWCHNTCLWHCIIETMWTENTHFLLKNGIFEWFELCKIQKFKEKTALSSLMAKWQACWCSVVSVTSNLSKQFLWVSSHSMIFLIKILKKCVKLTSQQSCSSNGECGLGSVFFSFLLVCCHFLVPFWLQSFHFSLSFLGFSCLIH